MSMFFLFLANNIIVDDEIEQACQKIVKKLSAAMGLKKYQIPVYLLDIDEANASAISKGAIVLHTGLIVECKTPEEFIGVIAHELGHIKRMHIIRFADTGGYSAIMNGSIGLGAILAPFTGGLSLCLIGVGAGFAQQEFLRQMRSDEFEADQIAVEALKKLHWPVSGMQEFFKRLMGNDYLIRTVGLTTHPLSRDRLNRINEMTHSFQGTLDPEIATLYHRIRAKILGYVKKNISATDPYEKTLAFYSTRKFNQSINALAPLLQKHPHDIFYLEMKADCLFLNGQVEEAQNVYKTIIAGDKTLKYVPTKWVSCAIISKTHLDEALKILMSERMKNPTSSYLWHMTGHIYSLKKDEKTMWLCRCQEAFLNGDKKFVKKNLSKAEGVTVFKTVYEDLKNTNDSSS